MFRIIHGLVLAVFLLFGAGIFAQTPVVLKNTFQISSDVAGVQIEQRYPQLYFYQNSTFLISWEDMRFGLPSRYYRQFNNSAQPMGEPAQFKGGNSVYFIGENDFISTEDRVTPYFFDDYFYSIYAHRYLNGNPLGEGSSLGGYPGLWCGTGWMGFNVSLIPKANRIYSFVSNNGYISRSVYDSLLQPVVQDELTGIEHSVYVTAKETNSGKTGMFWINLPWAAWGGETGKVFARFYDNTETVIHDSVLLFTLPYNFYPVGSSSNFPLKIEPAGEDSYLVMLFNNTKLYYMKVSHSGTITRQQDSITLVEEALINQAYSRGMVITNAVDGVYDAAFRFTTQSLNEYIYSVVQINGNGDISPVNQVQTASKYDIDRGLFKWAAAGYYVPEAAEGDVYIRKIQDFITLDLTNICADPDISNERNTFLTPLAGSSFISGYKNEAGYFARTVSAGADPSGEQKQIQVPALGVIADGTIFGIQSLAAGTDFTHKVHIYSDGLEPVSVITIKNQAGEDYISSGYLTFSQRSDGTFRFITKKGNELVGGVLGSNFVILSELVLHSDNSIYGYSISRENDDSYLVQYNSGARLYDAQFNAAGSVVADTYGAVHVGGDVLVSIYNTYPSPLTYTHMRVKHIRSGAEFTFQLGYPQQKFKVIPIDNTRFLLLYMDTPDKLACRPYTLTGVPLRNPVILGTFTDLSDYTAAVNGDNLLFSWASRENGNFDIYGKAYLLNSVTDIGEEPETPLTFGLMQNYPNPFNPSTEISFTITGDEQVSLVVYDALGRQTAVLVNHKLNAGNHSVTFNGNNLPSGIYYCHLSSGGRTATAKMLLLK